MIEERKFTESRVQETNQLNDYSSNKTTSNYKIDEDFINNYMENFQGSTHQEAETAYINEMKHWEEYEKYEEERINNFLKKHNNFRSVFEECYEDKNLDKDMEILKNYLEKNNMLSTSLSISSHDLVVIRAKLVILSVFLLYL